MASRRGWRYFATRLHGDGTETFINPDLPLEEVGLEINLSGDNTLEARVEPVYTSLLADDGEPILQEWSTAIYAENGGDIRCGGILVNAELEGPSLSLDCVGFTGYGRDMPYTGSGYKGIKVDPIDVTRTIWDHIQSQAGGDVGLELDDTDTNGEVKIGTELKQIEFDSQEGPISFESGPYKLNWYTNHDLMGDVDQLASDTPFDYLERHTWKADGTIRHFLEIGYPKIGKRREDLEFTFGVNVFEAPSVARDGSLFATGTMVLGAGEGAAMVKSIRERRSSRLRRIAVVVDDRIKSKTRAEKRADAENQWRARLDEVTSVSVVDHPAARLGSVKPGDEIYLKGRTGWTNLGMWVRVLGISIQPEDGNVAEYTIARTDKLMS